MKINKATLVNVINKLKPAIPKTTLGGPRGILFKDGGLFAFNLEIGIKANLDIESEETFIIPFEALGLISKLPDEMIEIKSKKDHRIVIKCMGIETEYASAPPDQFPKLPELSDERSISMMNCEELTRQIRATLYAVDDSSTHEHVRGLLFKTDNGRLNVVGVDGFRASWYHAECEDEVNFRIPKIAADQVMKIIDSEEQVGVLHDERLAIFSVDGYQVFTRLLVHKNRGIDIEGLFKQEYKSIVIIRKYLIEAIDRVITADTNNKKAMVIEIKNTKMKLSAKTEATEYVEELGLEEETEVNLTLGINPKYFKDALESYSAEDIEIRFTGSITPIFIDVEEENLRSLLLPVKI